LESHHSLFAQRRKKNRKENYWVENWKSDKGSLN
jgi:hypothetical protein